MKILRLILAVALAAFGATSCSKKETVSAAGPPGHRHEHKAPHDGTPVVLGEEAYHLELVLDRAAGKLKAYVLDGEMENYIRLKAPSFTVVATVDGANQVLDFKAIAESATGETVGDTALFVAQADWLKTAQSFDAVLPTLEIRGRIFSDVAFNFPKGNDKD